MCKIQDLDYLFKQTHQQFGKIDVLVANAGIAARRHVDDVDETFLMKLGIPILKVLISQSNVRSLI